MAQDKNKTIPNVPPLRFPGFTDEWKRTTLGEISKSISSGKSGNPIECGEYELYGSTGIIGRTNSGDYDGEKILVARVGANAGKINYNSIRCGITDNTLIVQPKEISAKYIYYHLIHSNLNRLVFGSGQPLITGGMLKKLKINIPSSDECEYIVKFLECIDSRIATQYKIIDNYLSFLKGLNDRFHDNEQCESISFDELGHSYSGLSGKSGDDFGHGQPYITYLNVFQNNVVDEGQIGLVTIDKNEIQNTISYGDVLFTLSSETPEETGIGCVYLGQSGKYYLNSFCFGVRITQSNKVYPPYLAHLVSSSKFRRFVYPLAQGSTRFNLQKKDFMRQKFMLLPVEKQKEISKTLDALHDKISIEFNLLNLYKIQKMHLLRSMFI